MADGFSFDFSELNVLAGQIAQVPINAGPYIRSAVEGDAFTVKEDARASVKAGAKQWKALPRAIDYEVKVLQAFGVSVLQAEVGYNLDKPAGHLGNIREFGSTKAAPHSDLQVAAEKNADNFQKHLAEALVDAERVLDKNATLGSSAKAILRGRI